MDNLEEPMPITHGVLVGGVLVAGRGGQKGGHAEEGSGAVGRIMVFVPFSEALTYRKSPRLYFLYWRRLKCSQAETWFRSLVMSLLFVTFVGKEWGPHSKYLHSQLSTYYYTGCLRDWINGGQSGLPTSFTATFFSPTPPPRQKKERGFVSMVTHWNERRPIWARTRFVCLVDVLFWKVWGVVMLI